MSSANKLLSINDLPDDMLCEMFDFLRIRKIVAIQTVDRKFYRCSKQWLKTVDRLILSGSSILLSKTFKNQLIELCDVFNKTEQAYFSSLKGMLTSCSDVKIVQTTLTNYFKLTPFQVVEVISRCPSINRLELTLGDFIFDDNEWNQLVELIKHCDIQLIVRCESPSVVNQLKHLFTIAQRIESVRFGSSLNLFLKTIPFLDQSVRIEVIYVPEPLDKEVLHLISRRVDNLYTSSLTFQSLPVRHLNSTHLSVTSNPLHFLRRQKVVLPRLKRLEIWMVEEDNHLIKSFFSSVYRLDQLEQLKLWFKNFLAEDEHLVKMIEQAPKLKQLMIEWHRFLPTKISAFEKLIQFLSQTSTYQIPFIEIDLRWEVKLINRTEFMPADELFCLANTLAGFAGKQTQVKLKFYTQIRRQTILNGMIEKVPKNVKIIWLCITVSD